MRSDDCERPLGNPRAILRPGHIDGRRSLNALIVDDEPIARQVLREELELLDDVTVVGEAEDGRQALNRIAELDPDIVLLDLEMPVMGGFDVIRNLRGPRSPVIVIVTAFGHADWHVAEARIADVAVGGALALLAALVAPSRERMRLPDALAAALDSIARYARLAGAPHDRPAVVAARREVGKALEAAESSLERMLAEPRALQQGVEDAMYLVTYGRRVAAGITAQLEGGGAVPPDVASYLAAVLSDAHDHVVAGTRPPPRERPQVASPALAHLVRRGELVAQRVSAAQ